MPPEALRMDAGWLGMSLAEVLRGHCIRGNMGQIMPQPDADALFFDAGFAGHFQQLVSALYSMGIGAADESPRIMSAAPGPSNPGDPQALLSWQDRAAHGESSQRRQPTPPPNRRSLSWHSSQPASPSMPFAIRAEFSSPAGYGRAALQLDDLGLEA